MYVMGQRQYLLTVDLGQECWGSQEVDWGRERNIAYKEPICRGG